MFTLKKTSVFLFTILFSITLFARPIDKEEAQNIAKKYFSSGISSSLRMKSAMNFELAYTCTDIADVKNLPQSSYYYVFNIGQSNGFVIVSADSRTKKVLGYSLTGSFDILRIPVNLKAWLNEYANQIRFAIGNLPDVDSETSSPLRTIRKTARQNLTVEPLLGNISYDQGKPYNDSCPALADVRTVTGCGATAVAQVMKYYNWPVKGTGIKAYTSATNHFNLSADFGNTTYDWTNTLPYYSSSGTENSLQKAAIAKLMLHVGISIKMDYNTSANGGSSSYTTDIPPALYNNFGYDAGIQIYQRKYLQYEAWENILITELDARRPVLYRGSTADNAGHIFVCDGYDANGLFHLNWGWGGSSNGYFEISAMNPDGPGIGSGNDGYNLGHYIVTGIQKPVSGSVHASLVAIDSISPSQRTIPRTGSVTLSIKKLMNVGAFDYLSSIMGTALILSQNGVTIDTLLVDKEWSNNLPPNYYYSALNYDVNFKPSIPNGDYEISAFYRNEHNLFVPVLVNNSGRKYLYAKITSTTIDFISDNSKPELSLVAAPTVLLNLYENKNGRFEMKIKNNGAKDYYAQIGVRITKTDDDEIYQDVIHSITTIPAGETSTLQMGDSIKTTPGNYYLNVYYNEANNVGDVSFPTDLMGPSQYTTTVTVNPTPTTAPVMSVVSGTYIVPATITKGQSFTVKANVSNTGGLFDNRMIAFIFLMTPGTSVGYYGHQNQLIDNNQTRSLDFTGEITDLDPGSYRTALYYHTGTSWSRISDIKTFTLVDNPTSVYNLKSDQLRILETPVASELKITTPADATSLAIFTLQGRAVQSVETRGEVQHSIPVIHLMPGIYILKMAVSDGKIISRKFIKK